MLKKDERIDDLGLGGLQIIQDKKGFCFGVDAVLLANLAEIKKDAKVLDMGTGSGIIPLIIAGKRKPGEIHSMEIQPDVFDMCRRSILLNNLEGCIKPVNDSILQWERYYTKGYFDVITCNPPYKKRDTGLLNPEDKKRIARHETDADLEDFISVAAQLLNAKGKLFMIHRPQRLKEILRYGEKNKLSVKTLTFIHGRPGSKPTMVLIKAVKEGKEELLVEAPLYIYDHQGAYTKRIREIYGEIWTTRCEDE